MVTRRDIKDCILWALVLIYICCSIALVILQFCFESEMATITEMGKNPHNLHGLLMLLGTIIMGFGMIAYRVFHGLRTRKVKYVHMSIQFVAVIFLVVGYAVALNTNLHKSGYIVIEGGQDSPESLQHLFHLTNMTHYSLGYIALICIVAQFIIALFVFAYLYPNTRMRRFFAPYHDMCGIWILLGLVASYLTGLFFVYDMNIGCCETKSDESRDLMYFITIPTYLGFLIIFCIIVSPYYEWDLVGPV